MVRVKELQHLDQTGRSLRAGSRGSGRCIVEHDVRVDLMFSCTSWCIAANSRCPQRMPESISSHNTRGLDLMRLSPNPELFA